MFNEAHDALKYDNRLRARRGWISPDELAQELGALPDSGDKILAPGEELEPKPSAASVAPPTPAPPIPPVVEEAPVVESDFAAPLGDSAPVSGFAPAADPQPTASFGGNDAAADAADTLDAADTSDDSGSGFGGTHNA